MLDGGAGTDTADYSGSPIATVENCGYVCNRAVGVVVRLASGEISSGHAQGDTLTNIENVVGTDHSDVIIGDASVNVIRGGGYSDYLYGEDGNDTIYGDADADFMYGDAGNDTLYGGDGKDWIHGEAGDDTLYGGPDPDKFAFRVEKGIGADTIEDYEGGDIILICVQNGKRWPTTTGADVGSNHVITVKRGSQIVGTITLKGVTRKSPGFNNLWPSTMRTPTGACWSGVEEYLWK